MPLSMLKTGVSAAYGALDIAVDYFDKGQSGTFKGPIDLSRAAAFGIGTGLVYFGKKKMLTDVGEALELSSLPLLEKSVFNFVNTMMKGTFRAEPRGQITVRRPNVSTVSGAQSPVPGVIF